MGADAAPSRAEVTRALQAIQPGVSACAHGRSGIVTVRITVASSGRVRNVVVQGEFAGTRQGTCVARVVRGARFRPFQQDSFSVRYPFRL
ncbi:MAG: energy transducer TonB [Deltaproteobacteria bacterium]|nr:energy transducer TonB [Deltaproteobacteria bacterium]